MNEKPRMRETLKLTETHLGNGPKQPSAARPAFAVGTVLLFVAIGVSVWLYLSETRALSVSEPRPDFVEQVDHVVLQASLVMMGGWGALLISLLVGGIVWRRRYARRLHELEEKATQVQGASAMWKIQLSDATRSNERLETLQLELQERATKAEERAVTLAATNAVLQEELNKRNRAERALTQQRQELESSKSVLELHVQARTHELQMLQRRYELILNSAGEGICGLDVEGKATFVNPAVAKITGWSITDLIGKSEDEIFHANGTNGNGTNGTNGHSLAELNPGEHVFYRKDGTCFPVELVKTSINENGRVVGSVLIFKDITERKRAEETLSQKASELARSNAELEQFAFVASHDLQEPLRKIQAFGDRLKLKTAKTRSPEVHDYLERMQSAAARMQTLINDLLAFSRVIRSSEPFTPVDLGSVTRDVVGDLELRIEQTGAQVEIGELPTIEADPMQMRQLMLNLLGNALKFQPPGAIPRVNIQGRILSAVSGEQLCELTVEDNGIGFEEKYLEKIFAVFQRLHGRTEYEGTGVGLAVCRRITDRHGGTITARSQPGEGATFIVTLPLRQPRFDGN